MTTQNFLKKNLIIRINRLLELKILTIKDVSIKYVNWLKNPNVMKYTEQKNLTHNLISTKNFVDQKLKSDCDFLFGIYYKKKHIGNIKLGPINWKKLSTQISFFLGEESFWGKGIIPQVIKKLIEFASKKLNINEINAGYYEENFASAKVFEKCLFKKVSKKVKFDKHKQKYLKIIHVKKKIYKV